MANPHLRKPAVSPGSYDYSADYLPDVGAELPTYPVDDEVTDLQSYSVDDEVTDLLQDGSWEYPPPYFTDSAVLIRFWERVPVSDTLLERFSLNYTAQRRIWVQAQIAVWDRANPRPPEKTGFGAKQSQENLTAWTQARAAESARVAALKSPSIAENDVRIVARSAQMYRSATLFSYGDQEKKRQVLAHPVVIGPWNLGTLEDFSKKWLLDKIPATAFKDLTRHMPDKLDEMVTEQGNTVKAITGLQMEVYRMSLMQNSTPAVYAAEAAKHGW